MHRSTSQESVHISLCKTPLHNNSQKIHHLVPNGTFAESRNRFVSSSESQRQRFFSRSRNAIPRTSFRTLICHALFSALHHYYHHHKHPIAFLEIVLAFLLPEGLLLNGSGLYNYNKLVLTVLTVSSFFFLSKKIRSVVVMEEKVSDEKRFNAEDLEYYIDPSNIPKDLLRSLRELKSSEFKSGNAIY